MRHTIALAAAALALAAAPAQAEPTLPPTDPVHNECAPGWHDPCNPAAYDETYPTRLKAWVNDLIK